MKKSVCRVVLAALTAFCLGFSACGDMESIQDLTNSKGASPAEVSDLRGTPGYEQVLLTWTDPDTDFERIVITHSGSGSTFFAPKSSVENRANSRVITGLTNGTAYTFTVKTVNAALNKSSGQTVQVIPSSDAPLTFAPGEISGLRGIPDFRAVQLAWTDPAVDFDHIEIAWISAEGGAVQSVIAAKGAQTKTVAGLSNGTTYTFTVQVVDLSGNKSKGLTILAVPFGSPLFLDSAEMRSYLNAVSGGSTDADPVPLTVQIDLASGWEDLLSAIDESGKFVALDLSRCGSAEEFAPGTANTGESKVVALLLPDAVTSVTAGSADQGGTIAPTFSNFTALRSVAGGGVETVGSYAFQDCATLTTVDFPGATTIGDNAFRNCYALTSVNIPEATAIGDYAFKDCDVLTTVDFPEATTIGDNAFQGCDNLTAVNIPAATTIGNTAFEYCINLTAADFPEATTVGSYAFRNCASLTTVNLPVVTSIGTNAFRNCVALASVNLPQATTIGESAFQDCDDLTEVNLPAATTIGGYAFYECGALTSVNLPAATSIGNSAFSNTGNSSLTVTLGSAAPTLGVTIFGVIIAPKTVAVQVPLGATGYVPVNDSDPDWREGFRGRGWNGTTLGGGTVNNSITLTIEYL